MKAILFDFDGVIINSETVIKAAFTLSYRKIVGNGDPPVSEYFTHIGDSFPNIMSKMSLPLEMHEPFKYYSRQLTNLVELYDGIEQLLSDLSSLGSKMAIVTGKDGERTREILQRLKIDHYFNVVVASDEVVRPKPAPDPLFKAMELTGVKPDETIMVGDSVYDIMAASSACVKSCAVTWGTTSKEVLLRQNPNYIVTTIEELREVISHLGTVQTGKLHGLIGTR